MKYRNDKPDVTAMSMTRDQFFDILGTDDWLMVAADVHVDGGLRAGNWPSFWACFYTMGKYSLSVVVCSNASTTSFCTIGSFFPPNRLDTRFRENPHNASVHETRFDDTNDCQIVHRHRLVPPLPPSITFVDNDLSNAQCPYVYLRYMVSP